MYLDYIKNQYDIVLAASANLLAHHETISRNDIVCNACTHLLSSKNCIKCTN